MYLSAYQKAAMKTRMESCDNFSYMMLNLIGEVGEFTSKIAKAIRKGLLAFDANGGIYYMDSATRDEFETELKKEAGDILWQLAGLCDVMGWNLCDVARTNLVKLASRAERGVIDGNGDNR